MAESSAILDATVSGPAANAYMTLAQVNALFETFDLKAQDAWDELQEDEQCSLIAQGTRLIDQFRQWGPRKVDAQALSFPRSIDKELVIPQKVKDALLFYIQHKLQGDMEPLKRLQAEGISSSSILGQSVSLQNATDNADLAKELPAGAVRSLQNLARTHWTNPVTNRDGDGFHDHDSFYG